MARRRSKHTRPARPLSPGLGSVLETSPRTAEAWVVRTVPGAAATKTYRCPGCIQVIAPGVPHLVIWPAEPGLLGGGVDERRHWHTSCWRRRA